MSTSARVTDKQRQLKADPELGANAVLDRMKQALRIDSDARLAECLETSRANISKWRTRNSVPYTEAILVAFIANTSIDYILTGRQPEPPTSNLPTLDVELLDRILLNLFSFELFTMANEEELAAQIRKISKGIAFQYERATAVMAKLIAADRLSPSDARRAAVRVTELLSSDGTVFRTRPSSAGKGRRPK